MNNRILIFILSICLVFIIQSCGPLILIPGINYAVECPAEYTTSAALKVKLDLGEDYEFGQDINFSELVDFTVNGYNAETGGNIIFTKYHELTLTQSEPEKIWYIPLTPAEYNGLKRVEATAPPSVMPVRITVEIEKESTFNVTKPPFNTELMVSVNPVDATTNPVVFSWNALCVKIPNYQIQILRLYNTQENLNNQQATVDWSQALTIETESSETSLKLHLVEGTGYYIWRVRPIGNRFTGSIANDWNWGVWSEAPADETTINFSALSGQNYAFNYQQFDEDKNWIYSRIFSEENKIKETMAFANGLQQVKQNQVKLQEFDQIVANQTVYDFSGRPVINTMAAPANKDDFGYLNQLITSGGTLYRPMHFDEDLNYKQPLAFNGGLVNDYYSNANPDLSIPSAEGYPYSRILYYGDGTERIKNQSGLGNVFRLQNDMTNERTTRVYYSETTPEELIKVFGSEAPNEIKVTKIITLDPNKTVNIQYVNQNGKTIATCLAEGENNLLSSLDEPKSPIIEKKRLTISAGEDFSNDELVSTMELTFTQPTAVTFSYEINPKSISESCSGFCETCDYQVYFDIKNVDEETTPSIPTNYLDVQPQSSCSTVQLTTNEQTITLLPGMYRITRKIVANNTNAVGETWLNVYKNQIKQTLETTVNTSMSTLNSALATNNLDAFYAELGVSDPSVGGEVTKIIGDCFEIKIPLEACTEPICPDHLNFEEYLYDNWRGQLGTNDVDDIPFDFFKTKGVATYFTTPIHPYPWWAGSQGEGIFNKMVEHMVVEGGYDRCELWNWWFAIVDNFKEIAEDKDNRGNIDPNFDLLRTFLNYAGTKFDSISAFPYGSVSYLEYGYKYIKSPYIYSPVPVDCLDSEYFDYNPFSPWPVTDQQKWNDFVNCLIGYGVDPAPGDLPTGCADPTDIACANAMANEAKNKCLDVCTARLPGIKQQLRQEYIDAGLPVDEECVETMAWNVVNNCNQGCNLTVFTSIQDILAVVTHVDSVGSQSEIDAMTRSMTYALDIELPDGSGNCPPDYVKISSLNAPPPVPSLLLNRLNNAIELLSAPEAGCVFWEMEAMFDIVNSYVYPSCPNSTDFPDNYNIPVKCNGSAGSAGSTGSAGIFTIENGCELYFSHYEQHIPKILICDNICITQRQCNDICVKWFPIKLPNVPVDMIEVEPCEEDISEYISTYINRQIENKIQNILDDFEQEYQDKCLNKWNLDEFLEARYQDTKYHYTLYYYGRAGNLVKTIPPAGVDELNQAEINAGRTTFPSHTLATKYEYNSIKQLVRKSTPDGGESNFWYDKKGQLRFSQSAQQESDGKYTYSKYDYLGRVKETGETTEAIDSFAINADNAVFPSSGTERIFTVYTTPACDTCIGLTQRYLQNRVSFTYNDDNVKTYYSYDPHGNVEWMIQDIPGLEQKVIAYEYDLISNKVTKVKYNEGNADQFFHRYVYDSDNRIKQVQTSHNGIVWDTDASYDYYVHGPLKRLEIGEDHIQGLDYVYTLQGWLKGVNHASLETAKDPGSDNVPGAHAKFAPDAFGMVLGYHEGDFQRSGSPFNNSETTNLPGGPLYNGNISSWTTNTQRASAKYPGLTGHTFQYDELNRLLNSTFNHYSIAGISSWQQLPDFATAYTYDPNGNIETLDRKAYGNGININYDQLTYQYNPGTNQLNHLTDDFSTLDYADDLESQSANNYAYDAEGNLIRDVAEEIDNIDWNILGKVQSVSRSPLSNKPDLQFVYDAAGNRVMKKVDNTTDLTITYYVRDAGGNIMGIYVKEGAGDVMFTEAPIYGSDRIGIYKPNIDESTVLLAANEFSREIGKKVYEIKDHLGNVRVAISDIKNSDGSSIPANFTADISSVQNYYPFGSPMPGRTYNTTDYRFGFNGMEKDNELKGSGNSYFTDYRIMDPRVGRWLSLDPINRENISMYAMMSNNPILRIDPDGADDYFDNNGYFVYSRGLGDLIQVVGKQNPQDLSKEAAVKIAKHYLSEEKYLDYSLPQEATKIKIMAADGAHLGAVMEYKGWLFFKVPYGHRFDEVKNKYDYASLLYHENEHKILQFKLKNEKWTQKKQTKKQKTLTHLRIYLGEMIRKNWQQTSEEYKKNTIINVHDNLLDLFKLNSKEYVEWNNTFLKKLGDKFIEYHPSAIVMEENSSEKDKKESKKK